MIYILTIAVVVQALYIISITNTLRKVTRNTDVLALAHNMLVKELGDNPALKVNKSKE